MKTIGIAAAMLFVVANPVYADGYYKHHHHHNNNNNWVAPLVGGLVGGLVVGEILDGLSNDGYYAPPPPPPPLRDCWEQGIYDAWGNLVGTQTVCRYY